MSKQVEERVLSMQFDNKNFEKNVSNTMSTLDKFKQKLDLKGASKGLENVNSAAKKVDMSSLSNGVETVRAKFSALDVIGVTALTNITNSAINAGKRIVSALTIDPIKTGLSEYETKMNAIQVIKANTRKNYDNEADQMKDINDALAELNDYADRTIYNYTQMTNNVGKFVAQGLGAKEATKAVQGMANLAGASGASAEDMARATYQMSQALGGIIRKTDWNSLMAANMATTELKNVLSDFARIEGIDIDGMIAEKGTFENTLEKGWLSGELFTKAMNVYSDVYSEAELKAMGFNDEQVKNFKDLAAIAREATTEVKTMSQLWDVLKETAQSGWTQTWELIIGDFDTAKAMFTKLQVYFSDIINKMSKFRNDIISSALGRTFKDIVDRVQNILKPVTDTTDAVKGMVKTLKDYDTIVQEIIDQKWGNGWERWNALTAAGYDWAHAQNLVNERLGDPTRHATNYTEAIKEQTTATTKLSEADADLIEKLTKMSDAELKAAGYSKPQIKALRELQALADKLGLSVGFLIKNVDKIDGRWLLFEGFANIGRSIAGAFGAVKQAWQEIFNPNEESMVEKIADALFNVIAAFHKFSRSLLLTDETGKLNENGDKLMRTFKGIFAIVDLVATVIGGPLRLAFKVITKILGAFGFNILDITAVIGDALVGFRDWIKGIFDLSGVVEFCTPYVKMAVDAIKGWIEAIKKWIAETKPMEKAGEIFSKLGVKIQEAFNKIKDSKFGQVAKNIIAGLVNGLKDGASTVGKTIWDLGKTIIEKICKVLGIHSPSTEFIAIGKNIIAGLIVGITSIKILDIVSKIAGVIGGLGETLEGVGSVLTGVGRVLYKSAGGVKKILKSTAKVIRSFAKTLGSVGNLINAKALQTVAISIAILAGSVAVLALMDPGRVWSAVGVIVVLASVLGALMFAINKFGVSGPKGIKEAITGVKEFGKLAAALLMISGSLLLLAISLRIIGGMEWKEFGVAAAGIVLLGVVIAGLIWATKLAGPNPEGLGRTLLAISGAMLILALVAKSIARMEWGEIGKAAVGLVGLVIIIRMLIKAVNLAGPKPEAIGRTLLAISGAIAILAIVAKVIAGMEWGEIGKAAVGLAGLVIIIRMLIKAVNLAGPKPEKIGLTLLAISAAIGILAGIAVLLSLVETGALIKGVAAVGVLGGLMVALIKATRGATDCMKNIITITIAIAVIAAAVITLSCLDTTKVLVAAGSMAVLMGILVGVIAVAGKTKGSPQTLLALSAAILVMAGALYVLAQLPADSLKAASIALIAIAGALLIMCVAAAVVQSVAPGALHALAGALGALGFAALATGIGVALFAAGFAALGAAIKFGGTEIIGFIVQLVALIPFFATQIGLGLVAIFKAIASSASALCEALTVIVLAAIDALVTIIPSIAEGVLKIVVGILEKLVEYLPQIVPLLVELFIKLLDGVVEFLPVIVEKVFSFLGSLFGAIGENIALLIDPLVKLFSAIFQGIAEIIGPIIRTVIAPLLTILKDLIIGLVEALAPYMPMICSTIIKVTETIYGAIVKIVELLAPYIPDILSLVETIVNAFVTLVQEISPIIDSISGLIKTLGTAITDILGGAADVIKAFGDAVRNSLDGIAGIFDSAFGGVADIINSVGDLIKGFLDGIAGIIEAVGNAALNAGAGFEKLANGIKTITKLKLADMVASLAAVASGMTDIGKHDKKISAVGTGMKKIADSVKTSKESFTNMSTGIVGMITNMTAIGPAASTSMSALTTAVNGATDSLALTSSSVAKSTLSITASVTTMGTSCVTTIKAFYAQMAEAGKHLMSGLATGIIANSPAVLIAARTVASSVERIIRSAWQVNSPSKLFYGIALGIGEGIEYALGDSTEGVKNSARDLADNTSRGFGDAISIINEMFNGTLENQPTIRPVLDLSDVKDGANTIAGMFSGNRTLSVSAAGIGAISASMSNRQYGGNDLVSAINKLAKSNGKSGDTYQINGVTYNEGSDVADAIKTLVRATTMEGRT